MDGVDLVEDRDSACAEGSCDESKSENGDFEDWKSDAEEREPCKCLFCDAVDIPKSVLAHCTVDHGFDILSLLRAKGWCTH